MKELICIICPIGCRLSVDENQNITGNTCHRGEIYAKSEITFPKRMVTSTVKIEGGICRRLPVKTDKPIDKHKVFEVITALNNLNLVSPICVGDLIISNVLGTDINIISTSNI